MLKNKIALISGGASGIGQAIALVWAREGATVIISDIDTEAGEQIARQINAGGGKSVFYRADAGSSEDNEVLIEKIMQQFHRLDVSCNNAGIGGVNVAAAEYPLDDWESVLRVNLSGVFYACKYQIAAMLKGNGGAIVNMASILSTVGMAGMSAYVAAKHGVLGLTRVLALDYGKQGIRVNAVGPGFIETAMNKTMLLDKNIRSQLINTHPINRFGKAEEVAELVTWLCCERASYVSGGYYPVDGGYLAQ